MLLQHSSELAIRAALFLAQQERGKLSPVHQIAAGTGGSPAYLAKVLQRLAGAGLVRSFRGPGKGMELGRAPERITLAAVVEAVEGTADQDRCVLGLKLCSEETPCALHNEWVPFRNGIRNLLEQTTLADLIPLLDKRTT